jgi:nondiscriminating aspartyl-tRNA synthetase
MLGPGRGAGVHGGSQCGQHRVRELGSFLLLRARSGTAQCVLEGRAEATPESVVIARGQVAANDKAPGGDEVQVRDLEVVARAEQDLPVPVNQGPEKLSLKAVLDHRIRAC